MKKPLFPNIHIAISSVTRRHQMIVSGKHIWIVTSRCVGKYLLFEWLSLGGLDPNGEEA